MKHRLIFLSILAIFFAALCAPAALAQMGSVKGVCKDSEGKPIPQAEVEWYSLDTGRKYTVKTNNKGEYFSLGVQPGKYKVTLSKDGKEIFHLGNVPVGSQETTQDIDLQKETAAAAKGEGVSAEQAKQMQEARSRAEKETNTVKALNDRLNVAKAASESGDFETAIATLNEANQIDATRDLIWFKLGDAYRMSATKQTDSAEKQKRYDSAVTSYQKAIDLKKGSANPSGAALTAAPTPDPTLAKYYNNLGEAYAKTNRTDEAIKTYEQAAALDPAEAGGFYFNEGATLTNAGKVDEAIAAFNKVIAADPTKADAFYWKGVNMIGKATLKGDKMVAPDGTAECFQKYLELEPTGKWAQPAKDMLASIGASIETTFGNKKAPPPKKK